MSATKEFNVDNQIYKVLTVEQWEQAKISGSIITELDKKDGFIHLSTAAQLNACLLYTSPSPRDATLSRMPSSA